MSRFPGLQFPVNNSGQPQTRGQQRPGVNLLQRLFEMKGAKLAKQGQDFQEDSFNAAKEAYEGALQTYETNKAAHDASEQAKYDAAQSRYNTGLSNYNTAKAAYDTQVTNYNTELEKYNTEVNNQTALSSFSNNIYGPSNLTGYKTFYDQYGTPYRATVTRDWRGNEIPTGNVYYPGSNEYRAISGEAISSIVPITAQVPTEMPSFTAAPPTFDYTATDFGSPVPSFEYNAPPSPGAANANKLATMTGLSKQLQEVLPENARNRNRAPQSFYAMF